MGLRQSLTKARQLSPHILGLAALLLAAFRFWVALGPTENVPMEPHGPQLILKEARETADASDAFIRGIEDNRRKIEDAGGDRDVLQQLRKERHRLLEIMKTRVEEHKRLTEEREARSNARVRQTRIWSAASGILLLVVATYLLTERYRAAHGGGDALTP